MNQEVRSILAELRRRFEAIYGDRLVKMILFGSQARGDAEPGSDIDVLVVLKGEVDPCEEIDRTSDVRLELCLGHEVVAGCIFMDEDYFTTRQGPLLRNVRREGIAV